jgi:probable rRNA maturation factor
MINLDIAKDYRPLVNSSLLLETIGATLRHEGIEDSADLTLVITGDSAIRELNLTYRGLDSPTDVLSFPANHTDPDTGAAYLGDVVISYQQAESHSVAGGHSVDDELQLLIVHGVLHLLDHDHESPEEKDRMWSAQAGILADLGSTLILPD